METELKNHDPDFPAKMLFHDPKDDKVKQMEVTEEAWNNTIKTFQDKENVSRNVVFKYMSKHDTAKTQPYFTQD